MPSCPSCGYDPPMPPGYLILHDTEVTPAMQVWAKSLAFDSRVQYGDEFDRQFALKDGSQGLVTARIEHHNWTTDAQGNQVCGCFRGATLYHSPLRSPQYPPSPTPMENGSQAVAALGYVSLAIVLFSTVFGVASSIMSARARRRAAA